MNACPTASAFIFDLDGTLVDSAPDIAASVAHALQTIGFEAPSLARIRSFIGNGADRLIHRSLTDDINGTADDVLFNRAAKLFFRHYEDNVCCRSIVYASVTETLTALRNRGHLLACVTNKPTRFTDPLLKQLGLDQFFPITLSGDSLEAKKPAPDQLLFVAEHFKIAPQQCVMIGDTITDIVAAENANMSSIYVSYGYGDISDIDLRHPLAVVDSLDQIIDLLNAVPDARKGSLVLPA
jgi:phosphoglycolate phosphatase